MKKINARRTHTTKEIREMHVEAGERHNRRRSTQTTVLLSRFTIAAVPTPALAKSLARECEQVAKRFTRQTPRLLDVTVKSKQVTMHVAQPQLAVHLGEHVSQSYKQWTPSTTVVWSRDELNKVVEVTVTFHEKRELKSLKPGKHQPKAGAELHRWSEWYAWQEKQQKKVK
jgi:hypothetical protein